MAFQSLVNTTYKMLLGTKGIATNGAKMLLVAPGISTRNKKLLVTRALLPSRLQQTLLPTHCPHVSSVFPPFPGLRAEEPVDHFVPKASHPFGDRPRGAVVQLHHTCARSDRTLRTEPRASLLGARTLRTGLLAVLLGTRRLRTERRLYHTCRLRLCRLPVTGDRRWSRFKDVGF